MDINENTIGVLRLFEIIGRSATSEAKAAENRSKVRKDPEKCWALRHARPALQGLWPVSKTTFYNALAAGHFPKPIEGLCGRAVFWRRSDVLAFLAGAAPPKTKAARGQRAASENSLADKSEDTTAHSALQVSPATVAVCGVGS